MARRRSARRGGGGFRLTVGALVAAGLAALALGFLIVRNPQTGQLGPEPAVDDAMGGAARTATAPLHDAGSFTQRLASMWTAAQRVEQLERENAELREWRAMALALAERNARYETLLRIPPQDLGAVLRPAQGVSARLVLDVGGPFRRTLLANAGADHGVRSGYVAVNENGLIGRVVSVGRRSSRILLLDDYNSRVPVMGQTSRVRAILAGEPGGEPELEGLIKLSPPKLQNLVGVTAPREGEMIVTSGDGGLYPPGLPVGRATLGRDGTWRARLGAANAPIDFVRLIPFAPVEPPEAAPANDGGPPPPPPSARELAAAAPRPLAPPPVVRTPPRAAPTPTPAGEATEVDTPPAAPAPATTPVTPTPTGGAP